MRKDAEKGVWELARVRTGKEGRTAENKETRMNPKRQRGAKWTRLLW